MKWREEGSAGEEAEGFQVDRLGSGEGEGEAGAVVEAVGVVAGGWVVAEHGDDCDVIVDDLLILMLFFVGQCCYRCQCH